MRAHSACACSGHAHVINSTGSRLFFPTGGGGSHLPVPAIYSGGKVHWTVVPGFTRCTAIDFPWIVDVRSTVRSSFIFDTSMCTFLFCFLLEKICVVAWVYIYGVSGSVHKCRRFMYGATQLPSLHVRAKSNIWLG